jgi:hypothetical protein
MRVNVMCVNVMHVNVMHVNVMCANVMCVNVMCVNVVVNWSLHGTTMLYMCREKMVTLWHYFVHRQMFCDKAYAGES